MNETLDTPPVMRQLATFYISDRMYGIDVTRVQEVTQAPRLTVMHLAPECVRGLINLRGQIAAAVGMRELFNVGSSNETVDLMTIVCQYDNSLLSLIVDRVGDVIEVDTEESENVPATVEQPIRNFIEGVYPLNGQLLSVVSIESISQALNAKE